jgi:type IV pilus assembly protein PilC
MKYAFVAFDRAGKRRQDTIESGSENAAKAALSAQGLFVVTIQPGTHNASGSSKSQKSLFRASPSSCLSQFTRQMAILVSTGTPVVQALYAIERQVTDETFSEVIQDVRSKVEEGATLGESLRHHPKYFDAVAVSLVAAGEASGRLETMLERLAIINRRQEVIKRTLAGALMYPLMLVTISLTVMVGLLMFVIPRFAVLFESLDTALPKSTEVLMIASDHLRANWWFEFPMAALALCGGIVWVRSRAGMRTLDKLSLKIPAVKSLMMSLAMARIARILGVLLESKVPLIDALVLSRAAMKNAAYADLLQQVEDAVTRGESMSSVFGASDLVTPSFSEALRNGEESAQVGPILSALAEYLDEDNNVLVKSITQLMEPLILIVLGFIVGTVAVSLFLPLFDATSATSPGVH